MFKESIKIWFSIKAVSNYVRVCGPVEQCKTAKSPAAANLFVSLRKILILNCFINPSTPLVLTGNITFKC